MPALFAETHARSFIAIVFGILAFGIAGTGYFVFDYQRHLTGRDAEQRLAAIAELRSEQIAAWISERRANARVQGRRSLLAGAIARWLEQGSPDGATASAIKSQLALIAQSYDYRTVTLLDAQGRPRLSTLAPPEISGVESAAAAEAMRTGNTVISDFHLSVGGGNEGEPEIDILAPVYAGDDKSSPVGTLIFDIDPEISLHPLIESWPTPSPSAETFLVERAENRVRYLTDLRHLKNAQFNLDRPIEQADLVEAMGLRGQRGLATGVDYRGVTVLAYLRPIPDSPWLMVAKVDRAEIYSSIQALGGIMALLTAIFIFFAALATISWVRARRDAMQEANRKLEERVKSRTAELEISHQELQSLTAVQESFQDEERKRIARELHDELAQKLTVLKLRIAPLMSTLSAADPGSTRQIQDVNELLTETISAVARIAADLRPVVLDELGLVPALRDLVEDFSEWNKVHCELSIHPEDFCVDNRVVTPLYRMVQESLTNVARHAQATEVMVSLHRDASGKITLDINDNGKGIANVDQSMRKSFGLIGMRERVAMLGGEMKIHSQPGAGTSIEICIP
jgi:signal transduction histidine kinase